MAVVTTTFDTSAGFVPTNVASRRVVSAEDVVTEPSLIEPRLRSYCTGTCTLFHDVQEDQRDDGDQSASESQEDACRAALRGLAHHFP